MEKNYFFFLFSLTSLIFYGQTPCDDANSDLIYAYSHVKSSYEANNISHLKYYANRSLEAFERSKLRLKDCGCETAFDLVYESAQLLSKVENAETYEDGRFFVKRARDMAQQSVTELDKCTIPSQDNTNSASQGADQLSSLQLEQEKLKQQQEALNRQAEDIKLKMAQQNALALQLQKEEIITTYKGVIASHLENYNKTLKVCNCADNPLKLEAGTDISEKSVEDIKAYYLNSLRGLTSNYLSQLNLCD